MKEAMRTTPADQQESENLIETPRYLNHLAFSQNAFRFTSMTFTENLATLATDSHSESQQPSPTYKDYISTVKSRFINES